MYAVAHALRTFADQYNRSRHPADQMDMSTFAGFLTSAGGGNCFEYAQTLNSELAKTLEGPLKSSVIANHPEQHTFAVLKLPNAPRSAAVAVADAWTSGTSAMLAEDAAFLPPAVA